MKLADFAYLVAAMREAQRDYFETRDRESLSRSKELERRVDQECQRIKSDQKELF